MTTEVKDLIIKKLQGLNVYKISDDGVEHTVRCPYCGDSKDPTHAHLGVKIDPDDKDGMIFHCFRCGASGIVTDQFLDDLGIYITDEELRELRNFNKKLEKLSKKRTIVHTEKFVVPLSSYSPTNEAKRLYLSSRLELNVSYENMQQNKIIPSILEFMVRNDIEKFDGLPEWQLKQLESEYIGFLSTNNNLITMRSINPNVSKNRRYYKLFANPHNQDNATFYSIPTQIDLLYTGPLNVYIAEGTFDILSVKYNLRPRDEGYQIFYAACGYSYVSILRHLIKAGLCTHLNVHIYADNDKRDKEHQRFLKNGNINEFIEHAYIHRNYFKGEKDFGVPMRCIEDRVRKLW